MAALKDEVAAKLLGNTKKAAVNAALKDEVAALTDEVAAELLEHAENAADKVKAAESCCMA